MSSQPVAPTCGIDNSGQDRAVCTSILYIYKVRSISTKSSLGRGLSGVGIAHTTASGYNHHNDAKQGVEFPLSPMEIFSTLEMPQLLLLDLLSVDSRRWTWQLGQLL